MEVQCIKNNKCINIFFTQYCQGGILQQTSTLIIYLYVSSKFLNKKRPFKSIHSKANHFTPGFYFEKHFLQLKICLTVTNLIRILKFLLNLLYLNHLAKFCNSPLFQQCSHVCNNQNLMLWSFHL